MSDERTRTGAAGERSEQVDVPVARAQPRGDAPTYSEKEVAQILQRAASLERGRAQQKPELTLAEVEQIAREAGLDPSLVRIAAQSLEVTAREQSLGARIAGAPLRRVFERVIDGELTQAAHERLSSELRLAMRAENAQRPPQISSVGRTLTMSSGAIELELTPRGDKTLLRIDVSCGHIAGGLFGGMGGGLGGGMTPMILALSAGAGWSTPAVAAAGATFLGGVFFLARTIYTLTANRLYRRMERLADHLAGQIRDELEQSKP